MRRYKAIALGGTLAALFQGAGCAEHGVLIPGFFLGGYGLVSLLVLVLDIIAILRVAQSGELGRQ